MKYLSIALFLVGTLFMHAQIRELQVEPNHSTVGFRISIAGFSEVTGKFGDFKIDLNWNGENLTESSLSAEIEAKSINTGIPARDEHLRTADFFDVEKYPLITFKSDSIQQVDYSNLKVFGTFSMHGVENKMVLPLQIVKVDGNTVGLKSRTSINRIDYGVASDFKHDAMPNFLAEEIQVEIDFWTRKKKKKD